MHSLAANLLLLKIKMKESFRYFSSFLETARAIEDKDLQLKYLLAVAEYWLEDKEPDDPIIKALMVQTKFTMDRSNYISQSASERWKKWGAKKWNKNAVKNFEKVSKQANSSKNKLKQAKTSEVEYIDNNILSTNSKELDNINNITSNINNLITELKELACKLWIAYDKKDERNFGKHILTAKEFWDFAASLKQTPVQFAKNIMIASVRIWYWKWPCSWPKSIYQNYSEVYNKVMQLHQKVTSKEWVF